MSLGRIGLTGTIGKKTVANIAIWGSTFPVLQVAGGTNPISRGTQQIFGNGSDHAMAHDGKFQEFRFLQMGNWKGTFTLQKNGVNTPMTVTISGENDQAIKKVLVDVPFLKGDLFRYNTSTGGIAPLNRVYAFLIGGYFL